MRDSPSRRIIARRAERARTFPGKDDTRNFKERERGIPVKNVGIEPATLDNCVEESQKQRVVITRDGRPVAFVVDLDALDEEQWDIGNSDEFWKLINERRRQDSVGRAELEQIWHESAGSEAHDSINNGR